MSALTTMKFKFEKIFKSLNDDLIIRDIDNPQFFFVTDTFKKMCQNHELNIKFQEFSLMKQIEPYDPSDTKHQM
ncbi:hypothetical protein DBB33_24285 [Chromobacterium haemolyticum]|nr:hypothetical protein DBB33_24285 [Chromobacterium haemolyticum]